MSSTFYLLFLTCLTCSWNVNGSSQVICAISCPQCPCFTVPPFEFDIEENSPIGLSITTLTATPGSDISYSSESSVFVIDPVTGVLSVGDSLDYEVQNRYEFRVAAVSSDDMTGRRDITINILNRNEFSPQCSKGLVHLSVIENQDRASFQLPNCTDNDSTMPYFFTYEIDSFDNLFSIDENHLFNISQPLDYETKDLYDVTVIVKDADIPPGSLNTTIRIIIAVEPANEYSPVFISNQFVFEVYETSLIGSVIGTVSATDRDSGNDGQVFYSISEQTNIFAMNEKTGDIVLARTVDYETQISYSFSVLATDNVEDVGSRQSAIATIVVNILDSNDNFPVFVSPLYYMVISENTSPGFFLMQFTCIDLDSGPNRELLYSITSGNNEGYFSIDSSSGNFTLASTLDYDNPANSDLISLTIVCREVAAPNHISSTQFLITVTGYNEFFPQPTLAEFFASIPENTHPGTSILNVTATDRDRGSGELVRYYINNDTMQSQSCPFDKLSIDENSGYVYLLSPLDYEDENNELYCVVTIWDSGYPEKSSQVDLVVFVTDFNDNKPKCFPSACVVYVAEDTVIGDIVFSLPCNDTDTPSLQYNIENDFFTVGSTGNLVLQSRLDFETERFHLLSILVSDGMFITNTTIRVIVQPVNEHVPIFSQPIFYCFVEENSPIGTVLPCNITAEDQDSGTDGEIQYRLKSSSPFSLDNKNTLFLTADIDFESQQEYLSQVEVFDLGNPSLSSTALINLTVLDKNDNKPKMFPLLLESIKENSLPGSLITNLLCTDADEGSNDATSIQLKEVFQMSNNTFVNVTDFVIFGVNNFNLLLYDELDFETSSKYQLNFLCTDHGTPPLSTSSILFLDVISENEYSPVFVNSQLSIEITEATNVGEVISRVIAVDEDAGKDGDIFFSLNKSSSFEPFPFDINELSGEIVLWYPLNCEQNIQYTFDVVAKDGGVPSRSSQCTAVINVTTCHLGNVIPDHFVYSFSIEENTPHGENVGSVSCSSNRANVVSSITPLYQFVSNDTNNFGIKESSGDIVVLYPPNFELKIKIKIVIECYDPNFRGIAANVSVYIIVLPENEFTPTFIRSNIRVNVFENTPIGTSIMQLHATDQDDGLDGQIEFSIADEDNSKVIISQHTGEVYLISNLDREITSEITFIAIVQDSPINEEMKRSSTSLVTIVIEDQNDHWPICSPIVHHVIISPRTEPPYIIIDTFGCVDNDINENAEKYYQFSDHTVPVDLFQLSSDSLLLISKLNSSGPSQYNIPISVFDGGTPSFSTNLLVVIDVYEPNLIAKNGSNFTAHSEAEGLENAIWIRLNDVTLSLSESESIWQKFQQVVAVSVTHYCALFPEACSLVSGCSEFFGVQQKRSVTNNYVTFDEWSVVVLSENTSSSSSETSLNVLFYVTIPTDSSRFQHRKTDYVIPRATMKLIVEQDGSTIEAVVRDSVAQQQPPSQQQEWIIVSVVSGVVGSFLLIVIVFFAISIKKRLKRNRTVAPSKESQSHNQDLVNSKRQSITSSVSNVSNKAICDDNRLNSSRIWQIFTRKNSESSIRSSTLPSKEKTRILSKISMDVLGDGKLAREPDIFVEDFDEDSFGNDRSHSSGQTSMENFPCHAKQENAPRTLITSLLNRKGSS